MSRYPASLHSAFEKTASVLDFAYTVADRLYWLDDNYVQPFYSWAAPRLRKVAISGFYWALVTLIDVSLWLIDITLQFMARDARAIALHSFAQANAPLPEFPALCPAAVTLALPSMTPAPVFPSPVVQWLPTPEVLDDAAPVLALCPAVVPMAFSQFLAHDHSVRSWLDSALPLMLAPWVIEPEAVPVSLAVLPVVPSVTKAAPVVKRTRKPKNTEETAQDKKPRKRSPKTATATAQ
jgi:hypothetical protein